MTQSDDLAGLDMPQPLPAYSQATPAAPRRSSWLSILMLVLFALAILGSLGVGVLLVGLQMLGGLAAGLAPAASSAVGPSMLLPAVGAALLALLLVPGLGYALNASINRPAPAFLNRLTAWLKRYGLWGLPIWALVVALGWLLVDRTGSDGGVLMALLHPLAVGLPVLVILSLVTRGISLQGAGRGWSLFGFAAAYNTSLMIFIETLALLGLGAGFVALLFNGRDFATELTLLGQRLLNAGSDPDAMLRILRPLLARPAVIYAALAMLSGVTPLLEELLKALPVFLLLTVRRISPAQGFVAGAISGAAMALIESLGFTASSVSGSWAAGVLQRAGTDLLHITTTALVGWALAGAISQRRYLRLALALIGAMAIHGLWNALALLSIGEQLSIGGLAGTLARLSPVGLGLMGLGMLALLLSLNRANRDRQPAG